MIQLYIGKDCAQVRITPLNLLLEPNDSGLALQFGILGGLDNHWRGPEDQGGLSLDF